MGHQRLLRRWLFRSYRNEILPILWRIAMSDTVPAPEIEPLPPLPPNSCALAAFPSKDGVHSIMRLMYDCTHLSDDGQKLLLFMLTNALTEIEKVLKGMNRIETAKRLAQYERLEQFRKNGNGEQTTTE
jgi:hypothetical protein